MAQKERVFFPLVAFCCGVLLVDTSLGVAQESETVVWGSIASGLRQNIAVKRQELARIKRALPEEKIALSEALSHASSRLDQLLLLRGVAGNTPWASRTLLMQLSELSHAVSATRSPLEDMQNSLSRTKQEYATLRQIRAKNSSREYTDLINEELAGPGHDFKDLKREVDAVKDDVDEALLQATALSADIEAARGDEIARFIVVFKSTYFAASGSLLRPAGLFAAADDFGEWLGSAPRFWRPILAWTPWMHYGLVTTVNIGLFLGVFFFCTRRRLEWRRAVLPGVIWLAIGGGLWAARQVVLFCGSQFTSLLWVAAMVCGFVRLLRCGRSLPVYFGCFLAGTLLDIVNMPASVVCALWPVVTGFAAWRLYGAGAGRSFHCWGLVAAGGASLLGYGPQALMLVQAIFMLLLIVGITTVVQRWLAGFAGDRDRSLATLASPLAAVLLIALYVAWVLLFMGGAGHVFAMTATVGSVVISLETVTWLCILFFLLRLVQAWFQNILWLVAIRGKPMDPGLSICVGGGLFLCDLDVFRASCPAPFRGAAWSSDLDRQRPVRGNRLWTQLLSIIASAGLSSCLVGPSKRATSFSKAKILAKWWTSLFATPSCAPWTTPRSLFRIRVSCVGRSSIFPTRTPPCV